MSQDIRAGRAFVEMVMRKKQFDGGMAAVKKSFMSISSLAKMAVAAAGGISFAIAIKSASDLEETMSKFKEVFGERADEVKKWGDNLAAEIGRSKQEVASFLAESQDLLVPLGFEPGAAEEMSKQVTKLAYDLASFNNKTDADAMRDLQAAMTGSAEVMRKYGVVINDTQLKQEAMNQGLDPNKISEQQKVMLRMTLIMRGTTAAQGDAARTADGFANTWKGLQGAMLDLAASLGNLLLPGLTTLVGATRGVVTAGSAMVEQFRGQWASGLQYAGDMAAWLVEAVASGFSAIYEFMAPITGAITGMIVDAWNAVVEVTSYLFETVVGAFSSGWEAAAGSTTSFTGFLQDAIMGTLSAVSFSFKEWQSIVEMAAVSSQLSIVRFGNQVVYFFGTVIPGYLSWLFDNWKEIFLDIGSMTATVFTNMWSNISGFWDALMSLLSGGEFNFSWTPLTDGFESAIKELPQIAEREMGPLEKSLQDQLNSIAQDTVDAFQKHQEEFNKNAESFALPKLKPFEKGDTNTDIDKSEIPDIRDMAAAAGKANEKVLVGFNAAALAGAGGAAGDSVPKKQLGMLEELVGVTKEEGRKNRRAMNQPLRA